MGKTYKDRKDYDPIGHRKHGKRPKLYRGCAIHGQKDCEWCLNNLTIQNRRAMEFAHDELENNGEDDEGR